MDRNSDVSDVFAIQIFDVVKAIRSKRKRPGCISIHNYINRHDATNLDEKTVQVAIEVLVDKTLLKNTPTADSSSYYIIVQDK